MTTLRTRIIRPGSPIQATPSQPPGSYQTGAVHFASGGSLNGSSALNGDGSSKILGGFTKGVISFWARYTPDPEGNPGLIGQIAGSSSDPKPSNSLTLCALNNPTTLAPAIQTVAVTLNPTTVSLYLMDAGGQSLLSASAQNNSPAHTNSTLTWFDMGPFASFYHPPGSTFNGSSSANSYIWVPPCSNPALGFASFSPAGGYPNGVIFVSSVQTQAPPNQFSSPLVAAGQVYYQLNPGAPPGNPPDNSHPGYSGGGDYAGPNVPAEVWVSKFQKDYFNNPSTGWHHYIVSFDTSQLVTDAKGNSCIRAQLAIDRGGGPIDGGPIFDTAAPNIGSGQQFDSWATQGGVTGTLKCTRDDIWEIGAPITSGFDYAYCYMGIVPAGGQFFDLTAPGHLDFFITSQLSPANLGFQGQNVPLLCNWMHTGNATTSDNFVQAFSVNAANFKNWRVLVSPMTTTDGPPLSA